MSDTHLRHLLRQVAQDGGLGPLFRLGLQPSQVAMLIREALQEDLLRRTESGALGLTASGYEALARLQASTERFTYEPLEAYRRPKLPLDAPFLPFRAPEGYD